jgi:hypothetical protein
MMKTRKLKTNVTVKNSKKQKITETENGKEETAFAGVSQKKLKTCIGVTL